MFTIRQLNVTQSFSQFKAQQCQAKLQELNQKLRAHEALLARKKAEKEAKRLNVLSSLAMAGGIRFSGLEARTVKPISDEELISNIVDAIIPPQEEKIEKAEKPAKKIGTFAMFGDMYCILNDAGNTVAPYQMSKAAMFREMSKRGFTHYQDNDKVRIIPKAYRVQ